MKNLEQWVISKIEKNIASEVLSSPLVYEQHLRHYGIFEEAYKDLYFSLLALFPQHQWVEDSGHFVNENISQFHESLHSFLGPLSFLQKQYSLQIVSLEEYSFVVKNNKFTDFYEIDSLVEKAIYQSPLYHPSLIQRIKTDFMVFEVLEKQYRSFFSQYPFFTEDWMENFTQIMFKNIQNALTMSLLGVPHNFYIPLMNLYKKSYFYLGIGYSPDSQVCYYVGVCKKRSHD